ncbi:MFS transporter [Candidatus Omnitrophota bacterium]
MRLNKESLRKPSLILSWSLYDLANQFFALNVVSLYFVRWLTLEMGQPEILYSVAYGISTFLIAASSPVLGALSDINGRRRPFLIYLTLIAVFFTMLLGLGNSILLGLIFFVIANFGCQTAIVFYNALMTGIAPRARIGLVSGLGKMFGYIGAVLALYFIKPVVLRSGYKATFLPTGILFLLFSLPCLIFVKDRFVKANVSLRSFLSRAKVRQVFADLRAMALDARRFPGLADFLRAAFFGLCAVNVIILFMSIYATRAFGMGESEVINLIAFSTLFAIIGSISSGFISDYVGHKQSLAAVYILWIICLLGGALVRDPRLYWAVGALAGFSLGSTWVVTRALAIKLVPEAEIAKVFGLFSLVGYLAAIIGSMFWGIVLLFLSPLGVLGYRLALGSLALFVVVGLIFLLRIPKNNKVNKYA